MGFKYQKDDANSVYHVIMLSVRNIICIGNVYIALLETPYMGGGHILEMIPVCGYDIDFVATERGEIKLCMVFNEN